MPLFQLIDMGHHTYVGNECLRIGPNNRRYLGQVVSSALPVAIAIAMVEIIIVIILIQLEIIRHLNADMSNPVLANNFELLIICHIVIWAVTGSWVGILVRSLACFGYYSRFAWWGVFIQFFSTLLPILAVIAGYDFLAVGLLLLGAVLFGNIFLIYDALRLYRQLEIGTGEGQVSLALRNLYRSLYITFVILLDFTRQQGARLVLAPLGGSKDLVAFTTLRTGANIALQGLNTVTAPLLPELMRYVSCRDQPRTESAFAIIWLVLCVVLCPAIVIVQWLAPALFPLWTHGKIAFDPWLFGMLSLGVSVLALAQPAAAVLQGNNIVRAQLGISMVAATVAVGGMAWLVPHMGVRGAGLALLAAEFTSLFAYVWVAQQWLCQQDMRWPWKAFSAAAAAVPVTALGMVALALLPTGLTLASLVATLVLQALVAIVYWRQLPALARMRAASLLARFLPASLRAAGPVATPPAVNDAAPKS